MEGDPVFVALGIAGDAQFSRPNLGFAYRVLAETLDEFLGGAPGFNFVGHVGF
jgi:hypothetical protein